MSEETEKRIPASASCIADRLRSEQFAQILRHTQGVMLANICNALVFVGASWREPYRGRALLWASAIVATAVLVYLRRRRRPARAQGAPSPRGVRRAIAYAAVLGSAWGALPLLFLNEASVGGKLLIACLCSGMLGGGAFVLASLPQAAMAFSGPIALGSLVALLAAGDPDYLFTVVVLAVYSAVLFKAVASYADALERRLRTQMEVEEKARQRLDRLHASGLTALGGMASGLAHEIAQPLASASAHLHVSLRLLKKEPAEAAALARNIAGASEQIDTVGDIIARLREFMMEGAPRREPMRLHALIEEVGAANRAALEREGATLQLCLRAPDDDILADRVQLKQVLANLVRNAIEAMRDAAERRLVISTRATPEGAIRLDVADSGTGVAEGMAGTLFEPFATTKPGGMGVGLAMCRTIVEAHGGRIWAEPNPEGGAIFSVVLPPRE
jgi:signal transduction histidine kinase